MTAIKDVGRKSKLTDEEKTCVKEMADISFSLIDLQQEIKKGFGISLTLPTITTYLKTLFGIDGYDRLLKDWSKRRHDNMLHVRACRGYVSEYQMEKEWGLTPDGDYLPGEHDREG